MPFATTDRVLERAHLVALHLDGLYSVAEFADRSHAHFEQAHQTPPEVEALIVACHEVHPTREPRKLLPHLARRHPGLPLPVLSYKVEF